MTRYRDAKKLLDDGNVFKLVCGAGKEDPDEVRHLSHIFSHGGALIIDVAAKPDIVRACKKGIVDSRVHPQPFIMISVGIGSDPHIKKAIIDNELCNNCLLCKSACSESAITEDCVVIETKCIGCGKCTKLCNNLAISMIIKPSAINSPNLQSCKDAGAEMIELHAAGNLEDSVFLSALIEISKVFTDNFISVSIDRNDISTNDMIERLRIATLPFITNRYLAGLMIQADGSPMSGGDNTYNATLQTIATADIIRKNFPFMYVIASGGTNMLTNTLAKLCGVKLNGIAVGTFARNSVKGYSEKSAMDMAASVVQDCLK